MLTEFVALRRSDYLAQAHRAAQHEMRGLWEEAAVLWAQAALSARLTENQAWANARTAFCLRRSPYRERWAALSVAFPPVFNGSKGGVGAGPGIKRNKEQHDREEEDKEQHDK